MNSVTKGTASARVATESLLVHDFIEAELHLLMLCALRGCSRVGTDSASVDAVNDPFYRRLNQLLREHGLDDFVEAPAAIVPLVKLSVKKLPQGPVSPVTVRVAVPLFAMAMALVRVSPTVTCPKFSVPVTLITRVGVGAGVGVGEGDVLELLHAAADATRNTGIGVASSSSTESHQGTRVLASHISKRTGQSAGGTTLRLAPRRGKIGRGGPNIDQATAETRA